MNALPLPLQILIAAGVLAGVMLLFAVTARAERPGRPPGHGYGGIRPAPGPATAAPRHRVSSRKGHRR